MLVHRKISTLALIWKHTEGNKNQNVRVPPNIHNGELCLTWERSTCEIDSTLCHKIYCKEKNSSNVWGAIRCDLVRDDEHGLVAARGHSHHVARLTAERKPGGFSVMHDWGHVKKTVSLVCSLDLSWKLRLCLLCGWSCQNGKQEAAMFNSEYFKNVFECTALDDRELQKCDFLYILGWTMRL